MGIRYINFYKNRIIITTSGLSLISQPQCLIMQVIHYKINQLLKINKFSFHKVLSNNLVHRNIAEAQEIFKLLLEQIQYLL